MMGKHLREHLDNMNTLKERYEARHREQMLMETISDRDLKAVTDVISRLKRVDLSAMPNIDRMVDNVVDELNNMLAKGGTQTGAIGFLKRLFTSGESALQGPIGKALALITTLETGFKTMPTIIQANIKGTDPGIKDRPLADVAGNRRGPLDMAIKQAFTKSPLSIRGVKLDDSQLADIVDDIMAAKLGAIAAVSKALANSDGTNAVQNLMKVLTTTQKPADKGGSNETPTAGTATQPGQTTTNATTANKQTTPTKPSDNKQPLSNKQMNQKLRRVLGAAKIDAATFNNVYKALKNSGIDLKWGDQNIVIKA